MRPISLSDEHGMRSTEMTNPSTEADPDRLTVYFDGGCPLCTREIDFYRKRAGAEAVSWVDVSGLDVSGVDVSETEGQTVAPGLTREAAMARFHVRRGDGRLVSGGAAFAELWRALPGFRRIGRIAAIWPVLPLLELAYRAFLPVRPHLQRLVGGGRRDIECGPCGEIIRGEHERATPQGRDPG
jgi:predicted DCC family thiol-disulfide oxidoreductase YuxK